MSLLCRFHFCFKLEGNYLPLLHSAKPSPWYRPLRTKHLTLTLTYDLWPRKWYHKADGSDHPLVQAWERWQTDRRTANYLHLVHTLLPEPAQKIMVGSVCMLLLTYAILPGISHFPVCYPNVNSLRPVNRQTNGGYQVNYLPALLNYTVNNKIN